MIHIKFFEDFENKISFENITQCIKRGGVIYVEFIKDLEDFDKETPVKPLSVDMDGLVTVEYDGKNYDIDIKNINKVDYN